MLKCQILSLFIISSIKVNGITKENKEQSSEASGGGPVDATFKALEKIIESETKLQLYSVNNITDGPDSLGEVTVRLERNGRIVNGMGSDTDIVIASAKAYLDAINKINLAPKTAHPQLDHV